MPADHACYFVTPRGARFSSSFESFVIHSVSEKKVFYFCDNFGKSGQIFVIFSLLRKDLWRKPRLKRPLPSNLLLHYLAKSITETVNSVQSDADLIQASSVDPFLT